MSTAHMKRARRWAILLGTTLLASPSAAWAHGGQFRDPGGGVPPGLRPPGDPTPPHPEPMPRPTTGGTDGPEPTPNDPPVTPPTPVTPGLPLPVKTDPDPAGPGGPRRSNTLSYDSWVFWWAYNAPEILRLKESIYRLRIDPRSPLAALGDGAGNSSDAWRATQERVRRDVIPALVKIMGSDRSVNADTRSAATLALAKVTADPAHIALLLAPIDGKTATDRDPDGIVQESAALSLGLLRRSEPSQQLDAKELDRVRDRAFEIFEDETQRTRTRAFALIALGCLGDQPTARGPAAPVGTEVSVNEGTTARLFDALSRPYAKPDLTACLLFALSRQPPVTVTDEMTDALKEGALKGRLRGQTLDGIVASYAALALGRVGRPEHARSLLLCMTTRSTSAFVKRSAAIGLGQLAIRASGPERAAIVADLIRTVDASRETSTRSFAMMSVAKILANDAEAGRTDAWNAKGKPLDWLVGISQNGAAMLRPYAALALGLVARSVGERPEVLELGEGRIAAVKALREGLDGPMDPRSRGAFAVGLGLAKDEPARTRLLALLSEDGLDRELRGYCALSIGMIGISGRDVVLALEKAMAERTSEELRLQCAAALGLLGVTKARDLLIAELEGTESQVLQGQIVLALARIGDDKAIPPLLKILSDPARSDSTRAIACAGLGLVGDMEMIPTLVRLAADVNYRACVDAIQEVLTIL